MTYQTAIRNLRWANRSRRYCRLPMCERRVYRLNDTICEYHKNRIKWLQKGELKIEVVDYSD